MNANNVTHNAKTVRTMLTIVLNVPTQELMYQTVTAQMDTLMMDSSVLLATTNVQLVKTEMNV
jgi:hypothetical protein